MGTSKKGPNASRAARKAKRRELEDAIPDLPIDNELEAPTSETPLSSKKRKRADDENETVPAQNKSAANDNTKETKKDKKKRKKEAGGVAGDVKDEGTVQVSKASQSDTQPLEQTAGEAASATSNVVPKKSKKERKAERRAREAAGQPEVPATDSSLVAVNTEAPAIEEGNANKVRRGQRPGENDQGADGEKSAVKAPRFIVFVGNLPFSATTESIQKHFAALKPKEIRHLTQKDNPSKSKGCAFVEFHNYDHHKTCLKTYHHTTFDDGISEPRKINIELSAGGGGNTKNRRSKIEEKNSKLNEQRFRRIQDEGKTKAAKKGEKGGEGMAGKVSSEDQGSIHPSRRAIVPGG